MAKESLKGNPFREYLPRRTFLRVTAASSVFTGVSSGTDTDTVTFELEGKMEHWHGKAPSSIEDQKNPPLQMEPGKKYEVRWTNVDGFDHNFVIIDEKGDEVVRTDIVSEKGATQTVEFEATEEMVEYFCEVHPRSMRGKVDISGREERADPGEDEQIPIGNHIGLEPIASGFSSPLGFEVAPADSNRKFIVDQTGQVYVHEKGCLQEEPFIDISDRIVELGVEELHGYDERGLLGLAFHPEFADNRKFYLRYSAPPRPGTPESYDHTEILSEFTATEDLNEGNPASEKVLLEIPSPQMNHNGGAVVFGPDDGYLYTSIGDGGSADDVGPGHVDDWYDRNEGGNGQDVTENLLGSILRIDVDSDEGCGNDEKPYTVPADNPLVGTEGLDEHYAWGFRNPWRMSFNHGELFVSDSGQNLYEEVNIVEKGGNYGWNVKEGTHCFSTEQPNEPPEECPSETPDGEPLLDPIIEYRHRKSTTAFIDGSVVIGGFMYEGEAIPELQGSYIFGNWSGSGVVQTDGEIFAATPPEGNSWNEETENKENGELWSLEELVVEGSHDGKLNRYVMAFGRDHDGELYVLITEKFTPTGETGAVYKFVQAGGGAEIPPPEEGGHGH